MDASVFMFVLLASELIAVSVWYLVTKYKIESKKTRQYTVVENVESLGLVLS